MKKEKVFKILTLIFVILTFIGASYIFIKEGYANALFAVIPCIFSVVFAILCLKEKGHK